jgi:hypothetical protein
LQAKSGQIGNLVFAPIVLWAKNLDTGVHALVADVDMGTSDKSFDLARPLSAKWAFHFITSHSLNMVRRSAQFHLIKVIVIGSWIQQFPKDDAGKELALRFKKQRGSRRFFFCIAGTPAEPRTVLLREEV